MNNTKVIVRKSSSLSMDGASETVYEIVGVDTRIKREVAMLTLTLNELETYVAFLGMLVKNEKLKGGAQ